MSKKKEDRNPNFFEKSIVSDRDKKLPYAWMRSTMAKLDNYLAKQANEIKVSKENKSKQERRKEAAGETQ